MSSRRVSLQTKLLGVAALLLSFTAIIAVVGITSLSSVDHVAEEMYTESTQPLEELGIARAKANENRALLNNHILAATAAEKDELEESIAANDDIIEEHLAKVSPTLQTPAGKEAFASIERNLADYRSVREGVIATSHQADDIPLAEAAEIMREAAELNRAEAVPVFTAAADGFNQLFDSKVQLAQDEDEQIKATFASKRTLAIVLLVVALVLGFGASYLVARGIRRGVAQIQDTLGLLRGKCVAGLQDGIRALAGGDLTVEVVPTTPPIERISGDEIGDVARQVNEIREATVASIQEYNATREALGEMVGQISGTAGSVSTASQEMASTSDEAGRAVGEIAHAVGDVAQGAERQVRTVESAKQLTEDIVSATAGSARNAEQTAQAAEQARSAADEGSEAVTQATAAMRAVRDSSGEATGAIRALGSKSEQIGGIVSTITGIAEQTNLLALNAAIEAAASPSSPRRSASSPRSPRPPRLRSPG